MKKLATIVLALLLTMLLISGATAQDTVTLTLEGDVLRISGTGEVRYVSAMDEYVEVERIIVEEGITSIDDMCFVAMDKLREISLPNSLEHIGEDAFTHCTALEKIYIPGGVTQIEGNPFENCPALTAIEVAPENAHYFSDDHGVLYTKDGEVLQIAPGGIVGAYIIPEGTRVVGKGAFIDCTMLTEITIPATVSVLEESAFTNCGFLERINFSEGLVSVGESAFSECVSLQYVNLPQSVEKIDEGAFHSCRFLRGIDLPEGLVSIGSYAFFQTDLRSLVIPDSVTEYGIYVLGLCESLEKLTIGKGVEQFCAAELEECDSLMEILVDSENPVYNSGDGVLYSSGYRILERYPTARKGDYEISHMTEIVAPYAFSESRVHSVTVPDSVSIIGINAFKNCIDLRSIVFGNGIRTLTDCFGGSFNLSSVTFGNQFEGFEVENWNRDCIGLRSLYFTGDAPKTFPIPDGDYSVYYVEGAKGWTMPTWNGLQCAPWNPAEETLQFTDMPNGLHWANDDLEYAVLNGYLRGTGLTTLSPKGTTNRAMFVTMLSRMETYYVDGGGVFADVPEDQWFSKAVAWAADCGIVQGVGHNRFDPYSNVTREQAVTFLFRYATMLELDDGFRAQIDGYEDAEQISSWATEAMQWAIFEEIINGYGRRTLEPRGYATREEIAAILMRFLEYVKLNNRIYPKGCVSLSTIGVPWQIENAEGGLLNHYAGDFTGSMHVYREGWFTGSPAPVQVEVDYSRAFTYVNQSQHALDFSTSYGDFYVGVWGDNLKRARIDIEDRSVTVEGEPSEYRIYLAIDGELLESLWLEGECDGTFSVHVTGSQIRVEGLYGEQFLNCYDENFTTYGEKTLTFNGNNYFDFSAFETEGVIYFCNGEDDTVLTSIQCTAIN